MAAVMGTASTRALLAAAKIAMNPVAKAKGQRITNPPQKAKTTLVSASVGRERSSQSWRSAVDSRHEV
jgi:hypothetical protein